MGQSPGSGTGWIQRAPSSAQVFEGLSSEMAPAQAGSALPAQSLELFLVQGASLTGVHHLVLWKYKVGTPRNEDCPGERVWRWTQRCDVSAAGKRIASLGCPCSFCPS